MFNEQIPFDPGEAANGDADARYEGDSSISPSDCGDARDAI